MPLFGRGAKQELTVGVTPAKVLPGQSVEVRIELSGDDDAKARALSAGIRCVNRYTVETTDSDGDTSKERKSVLLHDTVAPIPAGAASGPQTFTAVVPADAVASAGDTVQWIAYANVDRARGRDTTQTATFQVLSSADHAQPTGSAEGDDACAFTFDGLASRVFAAGQEIRGTLTVVPQGSITAKSVQLVLEAIRISRSGRSSLAERLQSVSTDLAGKTDLEAGVPASWPFALTLPADAVPSVETEHTTVFWRLNANVARGGLHKDVHGRYEVRVYTEGA